MPTEQANQSADASPLALRTQLRTRWVRSLAIVTAVLFIVSSAFPVVAGFSRNTAAFPKIWGILDVAIAFVLTIFAFAIIGVSEGRIDKHAENASYRAYRALTHGILAMIVVFFLFGDRIVWINCLTGFAWRTWLLLYILPAWFAAYGTSGGLNRSQGRPDEELDRESCSRICATSRRRSIGFDA